MRPLGVVVVNEDARQTLEMAAVEDQQPVETLRADGSDEALCDRVLAAAPARASSSFGCLRSARPRRRSRCTCCRGRGSGSGRPCRRSRGRPCAFAGHPVPSGTRRAAGEPNASARVRNDEEHLVGTQEDALDCEEVTRDDARRLRPQELAPTRAGAARRWFQLRVSEQAADTRGRDAQTKLGKLTQERAPCART